MPRLLLATLLIAAASQAAPVQDVAQRVADFRERQFVTGQRIGCQIKTVVAIREEDVERLAELEQECSRLREA